LRLSLAKLLRSGAFGARAASHVPKRSERFAVLEQRDIDFFRSVVGERGLVQGEDLQTFNTDWMRKYSGKSTLAVKPRDTQQVSVILQYCNGRRLAVVPQGGNTGLVGGSVPVFDEVVLSLSSMNKIVAINQQSGVVVCEAGCVLQNVDEQLSKEGFIFPLDLGAKGSCQIGGVVSTNAGGLRLVRYGSLHGSVLGLEAVLADGTIIDTLNTLRKDNTGYDIKQLFVGAEGTLGVVTKIAVQAARRPTSVQVALLACEDFQSVLKSVAAAQSKLCEIVSAVEFIDDASMKLVLSEMKDLVRDPMEERHPFYVLIETQGSNEAHDKEKLETFLEGCLEEGYVSDGVVAQDDTQLAELWKLREKVPLALGQQGVVYKYDLSIPQQEMYTLVEDMRSKLMDTHPSAVVVGYGHLGDGNLHLNIYDSKPDPSLLDAIEPYVYEWTAERKGSISAEHGIGLMKASCIHYSKVEAAVTLMKGIKKLFDPNGILNPYKVLPEQ